MLVENQYVQVRWNPKNKDWYESRGYEYTKHNSWFWVNAKYLMPTSKTVVDVKCDYCGRIIEKQYGNYITELKKYPKVACGHVSCKNKKSQNSYFKKQAFKQIEKFNKICEEEGYIPITTVDDYKGALNTIKFVCPKHGEQTSYWTNMNRGSRCVECRHENAGDYCKLTTKDLIDIVKNKNNNTLLNPEDYINNSTKNLIIECGNCHRKFITSIAIYKYMVTGKCKDCAPRSSGEELVKKTLDKYRIQYIREKRFDDCVDTFSLPFDFYLPKYNTIVEFDGQQHFEPKFGEKAFSMTVKHDNIKNNYCKKNKIKLIRISYLDGGNIEEIIVNELNLSSKIIYIPYNIRKQA